MTTRIRPFRRRERLAAPRAFAGTAAVRFDMAASTITGANLLENGLENVTFTGRQLETASSHEFARFVQTQNSLCDFPRKNHTQDPVQALATLNKSPKNAGGASFGSFLQILPQFCQFSANPFKLLKISKRSTGFWVARHLLQLLYYT